MPLSPSKPGHVRQPIVLRAQMPSASWVDLFLGHAGVSWDNDDLEREHDHLHSSVQAPPLLEPDRTNVQGNDSISSGEAPSVATSAPWAIDSTGASCQLMRTQGDDSPECGRAIHSMTEVCR